MPRSTFFNMHTGEGGVRRNFGRSGTVVACQGDRVLVTVTKGPAAVEGQTHAHAQEQWVLLARGACQLEIDGRTTLMADLDVVQIPSGAVHRELPGSQDTLLINIFDGAGPGAELPGEKPDAKASAAASIAARVGTSCWFNMRAPRDGLPRKLAEGMYSSIFASERLMVSVVRIDPNCKGSLHKHRHEQWGILIDGGGKRIAEHGFTPVEAGDMWFTPSNDLHTFEAGPKGAFILEIFSPPREDYLVPA